MTNRCFMPFRPLIGRCISMIRPRAKRPARSMSWATRLSCSRSRNCEDAMNLISNPLLFMLAKFFLVFVLIAAALPKLRDRDEFHGVVVNYRILPDMLAYPFARMLPYLELTCAALLLINALAMYAAVL